MSWGFKGTQRAWASWQPCCLPGEVLWFSPGGSMVVLLVSGGEAQATSGALTSPACRPSNPTPGHALTGLGMDRQEGLCWDGGRLAWCCRGILPC